MQLISAPLPDRPTPPLSRPVVAHGPLGSIDYSISAQYTPIFLISPLPTRQTGRAICQLVLEVHSPDGPGPLIRCEDRRKHSAPLITHEPVSMTILWRFIRVLRYGI